MDINHIHYLPKVNSLHYFKWKYIRVTSRPYILHAMGFHSNITTYHYINIYIRTGYLHSMHTVILITELSVVNYITQNSTSTTFHFQITSSQKVKENKISISSKFNTLAERGCLLLLSRFQNIVLDTLISNTINLYASNLTSTQNAMAAAQIFRPNIEIQRKDCVILSNVKLG